MTMCNAYVQCLCAMPMCNAVISCHQLSSAVISCEKFSFDHRQTDRQSTSAGDELRFAAKNCKIFYLCCCFKCVCKVLCCLN